MKFNLKFKNASKIKYVLFFVALISLVLFQLMMALSDNTKHIDSYIEWLDEDINNLIQVSINNKFKVAKMIFELHVTEETSAELARAIIEGGTVKDEVRANFLSQYLKVFNEGQSVGLRQFQFHLPNTESFLRLHKPEAYGDILIDIRQTVNAAIREREPIMGLEEGRMLNGYRYVFPMFNKDQLVGTVEFSYSYYSIVKPVFDTYQLEGVFLMEKDEVERKSFENVELAYNKDDFFDLGYLDKDFKMEGMSQRLKISNEHLQTLNNKVKEAILAEQFDVDGFQYIMDDQQLVWAMPMAIQDFTGKPVGTIVFYKNDRVLFELYGYQRNQMIYMYVTSAIVMLLIGLSIYFFVRIKIKATSDSLTKLYNRHYYMENVVDKGVVGSLLMIDIDDFKVVNDQYGHNKGDLVLKVIADILKNNIRESDAAIRWGGEEFLVILRNASTTIAAKKGEYILELIRAQDTEGIKVTVSIGVSQLDNNYDDAVKEADEALYYVKKHGKNNVQIYHKDL
jgi:diguanylate cyclase (GGDEF)-like protein